MAKATTNTRSGRRRTDEKKRALPVPLDPDDINRLFKEGFIVRAGFEQYRLSRTGRVALLRFLDARTRRRSRKPGR